MGRPNQRTEGDRETDILYRVIQTVSSSLEADEILGWLVRLVSEGTGCETCFVYLWDRSRALLVLRAAPEAYRGAVGKVELRPGEGVAGWVVQHRESVLLAKDAIRDPRYKYVPELEGEKFAAMLSVPIISRAGSLIGAINVHAPRSGQFTDDDLRFLDHVATLVAGSIDNARLFEALADKERALAALVRKTIVAQEEERRRVATEIHDGVTQQLVSIWYRIHACQRMLERGAVPNALGELRATEELIDETLADARAAIYALRPATLDDLGLAPSLHTLTQRFVAETGIRAEILVDAGAMRIAQHLETALYRVAQETLSNIKKHARASNVELRLAADEHAVDLQIRDDGAGFDVEAFLRSRPETSFGLAGMRERMQLVGGSFEIDSSPGHGTTVSVRVTIDDHVHRSVPV